MVTSSSDSSSNSAVVTNRIVLEKSFGQSYQEVRHLVLRGTNQDIGAAIAHISNVYYQAQCLPFSSLQSKHARDNYIQEHFPALAERQKGVAASYGWDNSDLHDSSSIWYDMQPVNCSAIFFPESVTANGHSFQARNMEFYTVDMYEFMHPGSSGKGSSLFSRNFVMETYPQDGGYSSLVVGTFDLMNGAYDGFNEHGLCISGLVDQNLAQKTVPLGDLEKQEGLSYLQMVRAILEGARTVDEAKQLVSDLKVYFLMDGIHFLIGDRDGNSMVLEFSEDDLSPRFTYPASPAPTIMTNHSVSKYPTVDKFPPIDKTKPYDTFYRYMRLYDYLQASVFHKYTPDDGLHAMSMVYGFVNDESEGTAMPLPLRTVWSLVMDVDDLSMKIRFYTADDDTNNTPVFSDAFIFHLQK
ncbi:MAG: C45 family autoproteolytic acyltransferase/hydrolase [Thermoleophilia bacterium]